MIIQGNLFWFFHLIDNDKVTCYMFHFPANFMRSMQGCGGIEKKADLCIMFL